MDLRHYRGADSSGHPIIPSCLGHDERHSANTKEWRIVSAGDGLLTRCSPQPPPTAPFSLDSTRLMVRGYYAKLVHRRNANSLYGWLFMVGVGRLPEGKNMDSRTTMLVSFAPRHLKLLIIYWSNALFPGICGSISFTGWVGAHSPLMSMIVSSLVGGRR